MKKGNIQDLHYEQILLNESPGKHYKKKAEKELLNELKLSNEEILQKYPPELMADSIKKRIKNKNIEKRNLNYKKVYIPLSAAAVFLLFFTIFPFLKQEIINIPYNQSETIRLKGNIPSLYIYRGNNSDAELLNNNSIVKERDLLQISYDSAGLKYGAIFSIDGRGTVTLHFPDNIYSNARLDFGGKVFLPYSYELDNAPFFERFFFVTSDNEIDVSEIMVKARRIAQGNKSEMLILPPEIKQQSIILFKEEVK